MNRFESVCLESPVGVSLLAMLEARQRRDGSPHQSPPDSSVDAVDAAVDAVKAMSFGQLCSAAVDAATSIAGPWTADAPLQLALAYRFADRRLPIAEAIVERFGSALHAPLDPTSQEWWMSAPSPVAPEPPRPLFRDFDSVYGNGEFTWAGLRTSTDPPDEAHEELVRAWEIYPGSVSRWRLPVHDGARVFEIHRPQDWVRLVESHPRQARRPHDGWELPNPTQRSLLARGSGTGWSIGRRKRGGRAPVDLLRIPQQRAAVAESLTHMLPDWAGVAGSCDAVHLSWAGFITSEGYVSRFGDGSVTMLRYWGSERTLWLRDVFAEPEPLAAPQLSGRIGGTPGATGHSDPLRRERDRALLTSLLGR